jgi:hypothetical protein
LTFFPIRENDETASESEDQTKNEGKAFTENSILRLGRAGV